MHERIFAIVIVVFGLFASTIKGLAQEVATDSAQTETPVILYSGTPKKFEIADIKVEGNTAIINGVPKLAGAQVSAPDLRAGAALVIAGLAAEGITIVDDIVYIQRGYERFEEKLRSLGAEIEKVSSEKEIKKFQLRVG